MQLYFVGIDGEQAIPASETRKQIEEIEKLESMLEYKGRKIEWSELSDPENEHALFHKIISDKETRLHKKNLLRDKPNFSVISVLGNKVVRLEYYEGKDHFELLDIRAKEIQGKYLPPFIENNYINTISSYLKHITDYDQLITYQYSDKKKNFKEHKELGTLLSNKSIKQILDINFDIITIMDSYMRYIYTNDYFIKFASNKTELFDITGKTVYDLFPYETADRMNTDDLNVIISGKMIKKDMMLESKIHGIRWFATRRSVIYNNQNNINAIVFTGWDITEKKKVEEKQYDEERKQYPPTIDSVYLIDINGKILACNVEGAMQLNKEQNELIGRSLNEYIKEIDIIKGIIDLDVVDANKIRKFENKRDDQHYDNTIYPVLDSEGKIFRFVVFSHNITNRIIAKKGKII